MTDCEDCSPPADAYLEAMQRRLKESAHHFAEMHLRYCHGESCEFCHPRPEAPTLRRRLELPEWRDRANADFDEWVYW